MSDPVVEGLRTLGHWTVDTPDDEIWESVKTDLQRRGPSERAEGIRVLDSMLGNDIRPTRGNAATLNHLREAKEIHEWLLKSGR